jgi:hypothetical protein
VIFLNHFLVVQVEVDEVVEEKEELSTNEKI